MTYTDPSGLPELKASLCRFMNEFIWKQTLVSPQDIIISSGCNALLTQLSIVLFNPYESILIPSPYYPAFDMDFNRFGNVVTIPVYTESPDFLLSIEHMEAAYDRGVSEGHPPRAFLLTNPHNPLGTVYSTDDIHMVVDWCRKKGLHLIVDEIYALSVHSNACPHDSSPFNSVATVLNQSVAHDGSGVSASVNKGMRDDVHVLWGLSKDIGGSGLRMGVLFSHNKYLLRAMQAYCDVFMVSNAMQLIAVDLLGDLKFMRTFIQKSNRLLKLSCMKLIHGLEELGITVVEPKAGLYLFANFRRLLREQTFDSERELHEELASSIKLSLTPGEACRCSVPGFFRLCYAWVPLEAVDEAIKRLTQFIIDRHM